MERKGYNYRHELLQGLFRIGRDSDGKCRVLHSIDKGASNGRGKRTLAGEIADSHISNGYRVCKATVGGHSLCLLAANVVWVLHHKKDIPSGSLIDHLNRNRLDNDPSNLAVVSNRSNVINGHRCDGKLLGIIKHVHRNAGTKRWQAKARDPSAARTVSLGYYYSNLEAALAYDTFIAKTYGPDAPTNASLGRLSAIQREI